MNKIKDIVFMNGKSSYFIIVMGWVLKSRNLSLVRKDVNV